MKPVCLPSFPGVGSGARLIQAVDFSSWIAQGTPFDASAPSVLFLLVAPSNIMPRVFILPQSPCEVSYPCMALVGGSWESGCVLLGGSFSIEGEIVIFGECWFVPVPPSLGPTSLARPSRGG